MLGPSGNPQARNLFEVIQQLQKEEGLHFELLLRAAVFPAGRTKMGEDQPRR